MSSTHKAYVQSKAAGPLELQSVPTPEPSSGQALVSVLASPIISYAHSVLDGSIGFHLSYPITPGISAIGRVISTGPDAGYLQPGQLVFCNGSILARDNPAAAGVDILHGWFGGMTPQQHHIMEHGWRNGSWGQKMLAPLENVVPLDETKLVKEFKYTIPELCWINELLVPFAGCLAGGLSAGATAIVAPATGHFGGCAVRVALAMGAGSVVAVGRSEEGLKQVLDLNTAHAVRVKTVLLSGTVEADAQAIKAATPGGSGADVYLDFSPFQASGATHPQACVASLKLGGTAVLMGGVRTDIAFNYALLMTSNITVKGNFMYPRDVPAKLRALVEGGLLSLDGLNTKVFGFDRLMEGVEFSKNNAGMADLTVVTPVNE